MQSLPSDREGLDYEYKAVDLSKGEQFDPGQLMFVCPCSTVVILHDQSACFLSPYLLFFRVICYGFIVEFEKLNPVRFVPVFVDGDVVVADSFAIILVSR